MNLNDIFANGRRYKVPDYQRDYSWDEEQWDDLWVDILTVHQMRVVHYMGAIVLKDNKDKSYDAIDGQQRLATLSLIALAVIKKIQELIDSGVDSEANQQRKERLLSQYVGERDAVSLRYANKLSLNENNDPFYRTYLVQLRPPLNKHRLSNSDKLLWRAFNYFSQKLEQYFGPTVSGEELADFIQNQVAEKLMFIQIVVEDELNAYTVFETLNARGIELTVTDLLKNYLLSLTAQSEVDKQQAKDQWQRIIRITDLDAFPKFLRYYWNSRHELVRKDGLFKALRKSVTGAEQAFTLLDEVEQAAAVYAALENPYDELWGGDKEIRRHVLEMKIFNVSQPYSLLLVTYGRLSSEFAAVLRFCSIISFRYNIIGGLNPNNQEIAFNRAAQKVFHGKLSTATQIAHELEDIYPGDEEFANAFSTKELNTKRYKKLARYILYALENQLVGTERNFEDESGTIEHILPENPLAEWESSFGQDEQAKSIYRIGNLTLLESAKNNDCQNKSFSEKKLIYQTSQYGMTREVSQYPEWTPSQVSLRQAKLAKLATAIWRISQLSD
ncbi:MAG TPA: DUF262 domain-containing HNH endonuclease family protein [Pyrinomonadaceae bacterium]|nr:DUF262 domain-containing HNH endonuclease family protein [Pyrinomonadaceae bacterium]